MAVFGQKQEKWGQSKQLCHSNLNFFDEVIIFELVGDDVKMHIKTLLGLVPDSKNIDNLTDRHTNSLTQYTRVCGLYLQVKFATSLLA